MDGTLSTMRLRGNGGLGRRLEGGLGERGNRVYIFYLLFILPFPRPLLPFFFLFPHISFTYLSCICLPHSRSPLVLSIPSSSPSDIQTNTYVISHQLSICRGPSLGPPLSSFYYSIPFSDPRLIPPRAWVTLTESIDGSRSRLNLSSLSFLNVYC